MKQAMAIGLGLATFLAIPALSQQTDAVGNPVHRHSVHHHVHHMVRYGPYRNGQGDEDGLSRRINDCNKGCIGGNPG